MVLHVGKPKYCIYLSISIKLSISASSKAIKSKQFNTGIHSSIEVLTLNFYYEY